MKTKIALTALALLTACGGGGDEAEPTSVSNSPVATAPAPAAPAGPSVASSTPSNPAPSSPVVGAAPTPTGVPAPATPVVPSPSPTPTPATPVPSSPTPVAQPPAPVASPPAQPPASPPPAQPAPAPVVAAPPVSIEYRTLRCETYTTTHGTPTGIAGYNLNVVRDRSKFPWAGITVSPDSAYTGALIDDADGSKIGSSEVVDRPDGNVSVTLFGNRDFVLDYTVYTFTKSGDIINIHPGMLPGRVSFLCQ